MKIKQRACIKIIIIFLILSPLISKPVFSQVLDNQQQDLPTFKTETEIVVVPVVVLDNKGQPLLQTERLVFRLFEKIKNRKNYPEEERELVVDPPENRPLRGGILIDTSGSTIKQFRYQKDISSEIVAYLFRLAAKEEREDKFFVAEFYYESLEENPSAGIFNVKQDWTSNIQELMTAIIKGTRKALGLSPLFGSIQGAADKFMSANGNFSNFLIIVSDGQNNLPFSDLRSSTYLAQSLGLPIYTLGTANHLQVDPKTLADFEKNLKEIANLTGGRFFDLPNYNKLQAITDQILKDLKNRYHLSYRLDTKYVNGDEVEIRIEVGEYNAMGLWKKRSNVKLLHRNGYRVSKPEQK